LADGVQEIVPTIFKTVCDQLANLIERSKSPAPGQKAQYSDDEEDSTNLEFISGKSGVNDYGDFSDILKSQLYHVTILIDLQINPLIRSRLLSTPMIQAVAMMLDVCDVDSFKGARQFMNALLIIAENLSCNYKAMVILA